MKDTPRERSALWDFMIEFYARPGVAKACLGLQEEHNVDVPLFLAVLRAASMGRAIDAAKIRAFDEQCAKWRETVIHPLRSIRIAMKAQSQMTDELQAWELRENIKTIELRAERCEVLLLERLIAGLPQTESPQSVHAAARLLLENADPLPPDALWIIDALTGSSAASDQQDTSPS